MGGTEGWLEARAGAGAGAGTATGDRDAPPSAPARTWWQIDELAHAASQPASQPGDDDAMRLRGGVALDL